MRPAAAELKLRERAAAKRFDERFREVLENFPTVTGCLYCDWRYDGTAAEGRELAYQHRADEHPDRLRKRRQNRSLKAFNPVTLTVEQEEEITAARARRMRLFGISHETG